MTQDFSCMGFSLTCYQAFYSGFQEVRYVSLEKEEEAVKSSWILYYIDIKKMKQEIRDSRNIIQDMECKDKGRNLHLL